MIQKKVWISIGGMGKLQDGCSSSNGEERGFLKYSALPSSNCQQYATLKQNEPSKKQHYSNTEHSYKIAVTRIIQ